MAGDLGVHGLPHLPILNGGRPRGRGAHGSWSLAGPAPQPQHAGGQKATHTILMRVAAGTCEVARYHDVCSPATGAAGSRESSATRPGGPPSGASWAGRACPPGRPPAHPVREVSLRRRASPPSTANPPSPSLRTVIPGLPNVCRSMQDCGPGAWQGWVGASAHCPGSCRPYCTHAPSRIPRGRNPGCPGRQVPLATPQMARGWLQANLQPVPDLADHAGGAFVALTGRCQWCSTPGLQVLQ